MTSTSHPREIVADIFALWTHTDPDRRSDILRARFHPDAKLYDPTGEYIGYEGLENFGATLRGRFPHARFAFAADPTVLADAIRAYWNFGPEENHRIDSGTDFLLLRQNKVQTLYVFVDSRP